MIDRDRTIRWMGAVGLGAYVMLLSPICTVEVGCPPKSPPQPTIKDPATPDPVDDAPTHPRPKPDPKPEL